MACANPPMEIQGLEDQDEGDQRDPLINYYKATDLIPCAKGPLHDLLQRQPAVLGTVQMMSGMLTFAMGMVFAVTQGMTESLLAMFRISHLTGLLFFIAGLLSNLLFKCPRLLPVCLFVNIGSITVAVVGAVLIAVDFAISNPTDEYLKMEAMVLCVLAVETFISAVLSHWLYVEKRSLSL